MPIEAIPIANLQESGYDRHAGASPIAMNVVVDGKGVVTKRPCVQAYSGATDAVIDALGVDSVHATYQGNLYAVGGYNPVMMPSYRNVYRVTAGGAVSVSATNPEKVLGTRRVVPTETEALVLFAAGDRIQKVVKATHVSSALGGPPPKASYVVGHITRLLANDVVTDPTVVRFSDQAIWTDYAGHESWPYAGIGTGGYFYAQMRPDPVVAIAENMGEVYVFGSTSLQTFQADFLGDVTDGIFRYAAVGSLEYGCSAPYSVIKVDQAFAWLDHRRRLVVGGGGEVTDISGPIQKDLDDIADVSDCFGYRVQLSGMDALVWTFPTDGRTFAYQKGIGWGQWAGWVAGNWSRCPINCACLHPVDSTTLVGLTDGRVGELSLSAYSDMGALVPASVETGYLDRKTGKQKWCKNVIVSLRRGDSTSSTEPVAYLSYSDQRGYWSERIPLTLGHQGDTISVIPMGPMGTYRQRAWKFEFSPSERLALIGIEEDYEVLEV